MFQTVVCLCIACLFLFFNGLRAAISAIMAGIASIGPNMVFAGVFFRFRGARASNRIVKSFYIGEALKLVTTFALFALVFTSLKVDALAFFITYVLVLMTLWFAPLILVNKLDRSLK